MADTRSYVNETCCQLYHLACSFEQVLSNVTYRMWIHAEQGFVRPLQSLNVTSILSNEYCTPSIVSLN